MIVINGIEGTDYGATLLRPAEFIISLGCTNAGNLDGGSSTAASHGTLMSEPHETNTMEIVERAVATILGVQIFGGNMAQAKEILGKTVTVHSTATADAGANNDTGARVNPFTTIDYVAIVPDINHPGDPNFQFLQMNAAGTMFVNYFYPSATQLTLKRFDLLTLPPPPTDTVTIPSITLTLPDGSVFQATSVKLSKLP